MMISLVLICGSVLAINPLVNTRSVLDPSIRILGDLFGSVDGRIPGGSDGLAALLSRILNVSVMVFGAVFAAMSITQNVIQTAAQGIFLGKKGSQSSYFSLLRTASGLILVFPQFNGYSLTQVFVMSIAVKSITFAGNLSHEILHQSMMTPTETFFSGPMRRLGLGGDPADPIERARNSSLLQNNNVQHFYKEIIKSSICAVEFNRRQSAPLGTPGDLYRIQNGQIHFRGCSPLTLDFSQFQGSISPQMYQMTVQSNLRTLINPVIQNIFYNLPISRQQANGERDCFSGARNCSAGVLNRMEPWLAQTQRSIESGHDALAQMFVLSLAPAPPSGSQTNVTQDFLHNWIDFPIMYQTVMDVKGQGLAMNSLQEMLTLAVPDRTLSGVIGNGGPVPATAYSNLSSLVQSIGVSRQPTQYDDLVDGLQFTSRIQTASTQGTTAVTTVTPVQIFTPSGWINTGQVNTSTQMHTDKDALEIRIKRYLGKLTYSGYPQPGLDVRNLDHIWEHDGFHTWNEGAATFDRAYQRLQTRRGTERALVDPVNSYVYHTAEKWMETYLRNPKPIILSPARQLGEVAAYIGGQSTFLMFVLLRNVMAEQVMRSYNIFWTFFAAQLATQIPITLSGLIQESMWDYNHCLSMLSQPAPGTNLRHPICSPMLIYVPIPIYFFGHALELGFSTAEIMKFSAIHFAGKVVQSTMEGLFSYVYLLSAQYEYAYYGYVVMAATPVMVISNLLAIWVPMLPSLIYFISIIGWVFAVIEAMIAAPLVVTGLAFPQGHDLLGASQQAMALFLSLFLRAPLIVVGFFMGMLLLSVAMMALSLGIVPLALDMFTSSQPSVGDGFLLYAFMLIVLYVTGVILMQAMSLTYVLPNKILLWVGAQPTDSIEKEAVDAIQSMVNQQHGSVLQSVSQAAVSAKSASQGVSSQAPGGFKAGKSFS